MLITLFLLNGVSEGCFVLFISYGHPVIQDRDIYMCVCVCVCVCGWVCVCVCLCVCVCVGGD